MAAILSLKMRLFYGAMIISAVGLMMGSAASIPFFVESSSILYKFGLDRTLLRTGKIVGILAGCLVMLQLVLASRLKFLDRVFALNTLLNTHRTIGIFIALGAVIHPALILYSEDMLIIPLELRYWPEFVGVFLLAVILGTVTTAAGRLFFGLSFDRWRILHQTAVLIAAAAFFVHVLFVSDSFGTGAPRIMVFSAMGAYGLLYSWVKLRFLRIRRKPFTVSGIRPVGREAFGLTLEPESVNGTAGIFPYLPGQFGFIRITSSALSAEEHPFTIASAPTRPGSLEFVIRTSGDWTRRIGRVSPGDPVFIDGPYGFFTHLRGQTQQEIIMIAGGIGITPMLSMLRYMADKGDPRKITLIWSNRTREHIIFPDEFKALESRLRGLAVTYVITEAQDAGPESGRLDQSALQRLLSGSGRRSAMVFVCGPPQMMFDITKALVRMGFLRRSIFTERFSL
ncbi:MAG: ferredoxin reductase family protein [Desulfosalsimonadaceae bacterium]